MYLRFGGGGVSLQKWRRLYLPLVVERCPDSNVFNFRVLYRGNRSGDYRRAVAHEAFGNMYAGYAVCGTSCGAALAMMVASSAAIIEFLT